MRTLKKSLALVLALVMVLGLGVIGASADNALDNYTDASEIGDAYYEAVGVLTGLGIIDGMTETTIEPTGTYTREQAAKIIATMVLGVKNAESLTCVKAPFDDVPADRWSAGYIAFCVEQGIIDGMTDTTFEPTGTLTGFQWAKMLLAAVGFGANGEFTGTSWSLNTARVAHEAGLFTGDLSGADHVNLSRQQAALYAFNTLTEIKQVTYTSNANNYVYGIGGYWFADGTGFTLGWSVFDLKSAEGIITDNEGVGGKTTVLAEKYDGSNVRAKINAETDAFLLYHGARIWYVADSALATTGDAVFVYDLADTTTLTCPSDKAMSDLKKTVEDKEDLKADTLDVGENSATDYYEFALIDNSAVDLPKTTKNFVTVNYQFDAVKLGTRSEKNESVVVDGETVKLDNVWTDISDIEKGDWVVYMQCKNEHYIYAAGATAGTVTYLNTKTGAITLDDGTVLEQSRLADNTCKAVVAEIEKILGEDEHVKPNYAFVLDSHGHYMAISNDDYLTVAYYTGAYKPQDTSAWSTDLVWIAQFVDVTTSPICSTAMSCTLLSRPSAAARRPTAITCTSTPSPLMAPSGRPPMAIRPPLFGTMMT